jgi:bifunctional non-homologous end joining protein LigD
MRTAALHSHSHVPAVAHIPGAHKAELTSYIEPCDPTLREHAPSGEGWVYEIKADGYRAQVHLRNGKVTVYSRRGHDWTEQFHPIAEAAVHLDARQAILDGEAVAYGAAGVPDFQALRRVLGTHHTGILRYHAFDLLALDGYDLRDVAYVERKRLLRELLDGAPAIFIRQACANACSPSASRYST